MVAPDGSCSVSDAVAGRMSSLNVALGVASRGKPVESEVDALPMTVCGTESTAFVLKTMSTQLLAELIVLHVGFVGGTAAVYCSAPFGPSIALGSWSSDAVSI